MPEGFEIPQGAQQDEEFDVTARVKIDDGKLVVLKVNGIPVKSSDDEDESEEMPMRQRSLGAGAMDAARKDGYVD